jgi:hypothetical protein
MTIATQNPTMEKLVEKYNGVKGEWNRSGVAVLSDSKSYMDTAGAVRWVSSNNIVPQDILEMALVDGEITLDELLNSIIQEKIETKMIISEYFNFREKHGYSAEEKSEMRATFGDEEVYDIFTGKEVVI